MALKSTITAYEFAALNPLLQAEYKGQADSTYKLDLGGSFVYDKDPSALLNAVELERKEHAATKAKFDEIVQERDDAKKAAELAKLQKTGDADQLKKYFEVQSQELKVHFESQLKAQTDKMERQLVASAEQFKRAKATEIATELFGSSATAFLPAILQSMAVKPNDLGAEPTLEFLDSSGTPMLNATKETFKQRYLTDPVFKPMIVGSKASGGSANEGTTNVPANRKADGSPKIWRDYKSGELVTLKKNSPDEYKQLLENR